MSVVGPALLSVVVLGAAGAGPALVVAGPTWPTPALALLGGALVAAVAAVGCLVVGGAIVGWFVAVAIVAALGALAVAGRRSKQRRPPWPTPGGDRAHPGTAGAAAVAAGLVVAALGWTLRGLRAPTVGFDARAIWLLHAHWWTGGGHTARLAMANPELSATHAAYPPLVSVAVAVAWSVTGNHTDRLGVVVIALLNAAALAALAWTLVEAGRRLADGEARRWRRPVLRLGGGLVAALVVVAGAQSWGVFATNGYADVLWSAAALAGAGWGLLLGDRPGDLGMAVLLLAVAGLTKDEGTAVALVIAGLVTARTAWRHRPDRSGPDPRWAPAAGSALRGLVAMAALGVWPLVTRLEGASADTNISGPHHGSAAARARATWDAALPHLHLLGLALVVAAVSWLGLRTARRAGRLGHDGWLWAVVLAELFVVGLAYVTGPGIIEFWLLTSIHRVTIFPRLFAWWMLGIWGLVALSAALAPAPEGASGSEDSPANEPKDPSVLATVTA